MSQSETNNEMIDEMYGGSEKDTTDFSTIDTSKTKQLSHLIRNLKRTEDDIVQAEEHVKELKAQKHALEFNTIPDLMNEMDVDRIDVDGVSVSLQPFVGATITAEKREAALAWLREHGYGDIIKNDVTVSFSRGQDNEAGDVIAELQARGLDPVQKTHVHPGTLKAFVKECVQKGRPIDLELFNAFIANIAKLKRI